MGKSSLKGKIAALWKRKEKKQKKLNLKNKQIYLAAMTLLAMGSFFYAWYSSADADYYAHAYTQDGAYLKDIDLKKEIASASPEFDKMTESNYAVSANPITLAAIAQQREQAQKTAGTRNEQIEQKIYDIVGEAPIREMVPFIAQQDQRVAGLIVGIAKKESSWGEHVPTLEGKDCFNYWGYKGAGSRGSTMGYGCFASPEEGVDVIGKRIAELVNKNITTPSQMVVWKCGSSCAGHDPEAVQKWITDVDTYFRKVVAFAG